MTATDKSPEKYVGVVSVMLELGRIAGQVFNIPSLLADLDQRGMLVYWRIPSGTKAWEFSGELRRVVLSDEVYVIVTAAADLFRSDSLGQAAPEVRGDNDISDPTVIYEDPDGPLQYSETGVMLCDLDDSRRWEVDGDYWPAVADLYLIDDDLQALLRAVVNTPSSYGRAAYANQEVAKQKAGRATLDEVAKEMAAGTGIDMSRWLDLIINAILASQDYRLEKPLGPFNDIHLFALNPENYSDSLPYTMVKAPHWHKGVRDYEQVNRVAFNRWLDARNDPTVKYRLDVGQVPVDEVALVEKMNSAGAGSDWMQQARVIADELFDRDTELGVRDTLKNYAERVMDLMQKREVHGPRGRITNANTIKRDALQGDKWWARKSK